MRGGQRTDRRAQPVIERTSEPPELRYGKEYLSQNHGVLLRQGVFVLGPLCAVQVPPREHDLCEDIATTLRDNEVSNNPRGYVPPVVRGQLPSAHALAPP